MGEEVAVASVVYNLAGDEIDRPDYLKSLVTRNVLSGTKDSMGDTLRNGYLDGPAMQLRSFYRWASKPANYNLVGMPTGNLEVNGSIDATIVAPHIPTPANSAIWVQTANIRDADPTMWAQRWILENRPEDIDAAWVVEYTEATNQLEITFPDSTVQILTPSNFFYNFKYIYAYYSEVGNETLGTLVPGPTTYLGLSDNFPSTVGWTFVNETSTPIVHRVYEKRTYLPDSSSGVGVAVETMNQYTDGTTRYWNIDYQEKYYNDYGTTGLFIYRIGSGISDLDQTVASTVSYQEFFPFIPFRLKTQFLSETNQPAVYNQVKKAFKKVTGSKLDDLIEQLSETPDLNKIDFGYIVFGVSLNTREDACKRYIYKFFETLQASQNSSFSMQDLLDQEAAYNAYFAAFEAWDAGGRVGPEPVRPKTSSGVSNSIKITGTGDINSRYHVNLTWRRINSGSGSGVGKPGAKQKDIWLEHTNTQEHFRTVYMGREQIPRQQKIGETHTMRIYWQRTSNSYTFLEVVGMTHDNRIYKSHSVKTHTKKAIQDTEESGFIIPLHYETWRQMSLVDASQMSTACIFAVFYCYEVHKTKWYQTGIFKIFLVIVIAVASVIFTGGAGFGLLGAHLTVGTALGFTGMTAAIVGSVANALAALVLMTILEKTLGGLGVLGSILSFAIMVIVGQVASSFATGGTFAINWGEFLRAENLLKLTNAIGDGVVKELYNDIQNLHQQTIDYVEQAKQEAHKIQQAYFNEFGYGAGKIDPFMFVDSTSGPLVESSDTFLTRTLMTGSEIAEMSLELLYGFPEYSLTLPNAFT